MNFDVAAFDEKRIRDYTDGASAAACTIPIAIVCTRQAVPSCLLDTLMCAGVLWRAWMQMLAATARSLRRRRMSALRPQASDQALGLLVRASRSGLLGSQPIVSRG